MFPEIPENIGSLSAQAARELAGQIREVCEQIRDDEDGTFGVDDVAKALDMAEVRKALLAHAAKRDALASADFDEDEPADEVVDETDETDHSTDDEDEPADDDTVDEVDDADHSSKPPASPPARVDTSTGLSTETDDGGVKVDQLVAKGGAWSGKGAGEQYDDWFELANAMLAVAGELSPGSERKITLASIPGRFDESQRLGPSMTRNLRMFEDEIMAEMCAPAQPVYDLSCWTTDRRPVRGSLASFMPDERGAVTIYPSPTLADLVTAGAGVGIWDNDDDISIGTTSPSAKDCAVIECASPTEYRLYGVWRCLQVQNLLAMTFPELVEAYLNRLAAWHARTAEVQLLEAMAVGTTTVTSSSLGYGAATSITSSILHMLTLHEQLERWDNGPMDAWVPRWVLNAMRLELMRRRNTNGTSVRVPTVGEVTQMFRDVGVEPHFFIDSPSWATTIPDVEDASVLNALPTTAEILIAPRGKFAVMDRGELAIGVTGNGLYRDTTRNSENNFHMFFENFEAIVDTNSCPAYLLQVEDLCFNGVQPADQALTCLGLAAT